MRALLLTMLMVSGCATGSPKHLTTVDFPIFQIIIKNATVQAWCEDGKIVYFAESERGRKAIVEFNEPCESFTPYED